ncbi:hypothetical protein MHU86_25235 [Fragilaria crotonensis]|nr:hypothetical protein MHU86_25235 [Fragilaria crotonensis]
MCTRYSSTPPATYARGRKRLDYALATAHVAVSLSQAGYEPFNLKFPSDHRAYFLDFDTVRLFGTDTQQLGVHSERILRSNNVAQTTQYIKLKYDMLLAHNAFDRGNRLTLPGEKHNFAERLDRDVLAASLASEQQLRKFGDPAWSVELDKAQKSVTSMTKCLSMARTGLDITSYLTPPTQAKWDTPFIIPTTIQECSKQLREAKQHVKEIVKQSFPQRDKERRELIKVLSASPRKSDKERSTTLRKLQKAEDIKQLFKKLKTLQVNERQGVT